MPNGKKATKIYFLAPVFMSMSDTLKNVSDVVRFALVATDAAAKVVYEEFFYM